MTYVHKKARMFLDRGDIKLEKRRSESRLKTYPSSIDLRNWCDDVEERRQHIIELIAKGVDHCMGNLIPLEVIIDAMMATKNADISKLKNCLKQLWNFIYTLDLTNDELKKLKELTGGMDKVCTDQQAEKNKSLNDDECDPKCDAHDRHEKEMTEIKDLIKSSSEEMFREYTSKIPTDFTSKHPSDFTSKSPTDFTSKSPTDFKSKSPNDFTAKSPNDFTAKFQGSGKLVTRIKGIEPGFHVEPAADPSKPGNITVKAQGPTKVTTNVKDAYPKSKDKSQPEDTRPKERTSSPERPQSEGGRRVKRNVMDDIDFKPSEEDGNIEDKLAAAEALCKEQQASIRDLKKERDDLQQKLNECIKELDNFKKLATVANPVLPSSCQEEIEALEAEIKIMRSGNPSPEEEAEIIKKEVDVLKRYCSKLKSVEDENMKLRDELGSRVAIKDSEPTIDEDKMETLKDKLKNLDVLTKERDALANKVHHLEKQLMQYQDLPDDVDLIRSRSDMLDSVLEERDNMSQKVKQLKDMEQELLKYKKKAEKVDELERELKSNSKHDRNSGMELTKTRSMCGSLEKELQNVKSERDVMTKRIDNMKKELDSQKTKIKEAEMLRLERDRLQIKLNELADIQGQYEDLMGKMKIFDNIKAERDMYKQKYEDVLEMECQCEMLRAQVEEARTMGRERDHLQKQVQDLESCICEQEDEIKNLVIQVDSMSKTKNDTNSRVNNVLETMKDEMVKKNKLLAASEEKLAQTEQLKAKVAQLEKLLHKAEHSILQKDCHIKCLENRLKDVDGSVQTSKKLNKKEYESVEQMRKELESAKVENKKLQDIANKMISLTGDEHVKKMLKQSECAVKRVVQELDKQYKEWDQIKQKNQKGKYASNKHDCLCRNAAGGELSGTSDCEKLRDELEELQKEKQKLELTVKHIQKEGLSGQEFLTLKQEKNHLEDQLRREISLRQSLERKIKN